MKRIISAFLITIISLSTFTTLSIASHIEQISEKYVLDEFNSSLNYSMISNQIELSEEEKSYCSATLDDDFVSGEIIVVLTKEQSKLKQNYIPEDFPLVNVGMIRTLYE